MAYPTRDQSRIPGNGVNHHWPPADSIPGLLITPGLVLITPGLVLITPGLDWYSSRLDWIGTHHAWIGGFFIVGSGAHAALFLVADYRAWSLPGLERVLAHRHSWTGYPSRVTQGSRSGRSSDFWDRRFWAPRHRLMEPRRTPESG
jgi:Photosystem I psaA/psaB protein